MIYCDDKYVDASLFQFPDKNTDPKEKKKEYLGYASYRYDSHLVRTGCGM